MVSNHGAHTLDYLPHPLQVIEEIRNVLDAKVPVFMDGGFRRGSDVFKGLAHGAVLVGLGRPILYGLAADGSEGVRGVVESITSELRRINDYGGNRPLAPHRSGLSGARLTRSRVMIWSGRPWVS